MKLLIVNVVESLRDYLISKLIAAGIEVYIAEDDMKALEIIEKISIDIMFIDIDSRKVDFLSLVKVVREKPGFEKTRLITLTKSVDKETLSKYIPYGLIGILPKNLEITQYDKRIIKFIDSHLFQNEKRKSIRITPKQDEKLIIRLPLTGRQNEKAEGQIIDLSIQGVAFRFVDAEYKTFFLLNHEIKHTEIDIGGRRFLSTLKLVRVGDISVGVFVRPKETFTNSLAKYIFEKLVRKMKSDKS